jgi:CRP-like cAMP-binding protein
MSFGEYTLRARTPCPLYAEALIRSQLLCVTRDALLLAMERWQLLSLNMVDTLTEQLHRLLHNLETCCLQSAAQRVAHYLLCHVQMTARLTTAGTVTLPASKAIVACSLDLTPETFSRELHQLEKVGLLAVDRRHIQIYDIGRLKQVAFEGARLA